MSDEINIDFNFLDEVSLAEIQRFINKTVEKYYAIRDSINYELQSDGCKNNYKFAALCASCFHRPAKKVYAIAEQMVNENRKR